MSGLASGSCPSLVLPSVHLGEQDAVAIHAGLLRRYHNAREVLTRVRQFFGNPWDRVSAEMQSAFYGVQQSESARSMGNAEPLSGEEATELALLLLSKAHTGPEIQAVAYAWHGAIQQVAWAGMAVLDYESFRRVFACLASSCRIPGDSPLPS